MPYVTAAQVVARVAPRVLEASTAQLEENIAEFEEIAEDYLGTAHAVRTVTGEKQTIRADGRFLTKWPHVASVTAISYDVGTAPAAADVVIEDGIALRPARGANFPLGTVVTVTYTHGTATVPTRLKLAAIGYAVNVANTDNSGQSRDVLTQAFDGGTTRYSTPDKAAGRPTGWLDVDRRLNAMTAEKPIGLA